MNIIETINLTKKYKRYEKQEGIVTYLPSILLNGIKHYNSASS